MNHNKRCESYFTICALPSFTSSPPVLSKPPRMNIVLLIETAAWALLSCLKRDWEKARWLVLTSMLRSESSHFGHGHCAKRCKKSWCPCHHLHRRRPAADRFPQQRGCGTFSLGRRIKGCKGWEVTWCRKLRHVQVAMWESFNTSISSGYDEF